jgi:hypothetical protein
MDRCYDFRSTLKRIDPARLDFAAWFPLFSGSFVGVLGGVACLAEDDTIVLVSRLSTIGWKNFKTVGGLYYSALITLCCATRGFDQVELNRHRKLRR